MTKPSFSIVLETENLAKADREALTQSLTSLSEQSLSPTEANEVWLIDSGDTPEERLRQLCQQHPWIKVHQAPSDTNYYKTKMLGAELATGEIVVYCDSDCTYEKDWLRNLLSPFTRGDEIQVVAGETKTKSQGAYGIAMALTYIFPQYSGQTTLTQTSSYFINNVAFRREFLLRHPIPTKSFLYRGNCTLHAHNLRQQGYTIWRQPQARSTHEPPAGFSHFFWRFLLIGHDYNVLERLLASDRDLSAVPLVSHSAPTATQAESSAATSNLKGKLQIFSDRIGKIVADNPARLIDLPLAVPIALTSVTLIFLGYIITSFKPDYLLNVYERIGGE
jgi:glycosyltransferase involved in cell wall biosynthesis